MDDLIKRGAQLYTELNDALERIGYDKLSESLSSLKDQMMAPDFWSDAESAQTVSKQHASLQRRLEPWQSLHSELSDVQELAQLGDESLLVDLEVQLAILESKFESLKEELKFSGPYDESDVVLSIHAGAGGTDAQDWTQMLFRMYSRWAEQNDYELVLVDQSNGEEAGIKSVTILVSGQFAYGKLKGENGVHRLVRLSPFNSDNLRQTSFAKVEVLPKIDQPEQVEIDDSDLKVDVYRAGGHGGQSVNTTDSAVRVTHLPTGIVVAIQNERSQLQNRETAMTILRSRLAQLQIEQHAERISELKGPNEQAAWGNQIRSYVLHPYKQVKDLRTRHESSDPSAVLDGDIEPFITAYLNHTMGEDTSA